MIRADVANKNLTSIHEQLSIDVWFVRIRQYSAEK